MGKGRNGEAEAAIEQDAVDLDAESSENLDDAMREALEAVESSSRRHGGTTRNGGEGADSGEPASERELLEAQVRELREKSLRTLADFDNYRKRVERERREEARYQVLEVMREFVGVVDNLERALAAGGSVDDLKKGVDMIHRQMLGLLQEHGVERVPAEGERFDPKVHDAVTRHEDPGVLEATVSEELQPGYWMHGRLLRPATVRVAMPVAAAEPGAAGSAEDANPGDD